MITLKIKYKTEHRNRILDYIKNYNSVFNSIFNYLQKQEGKLSTKESFEFINSLNNIFIDTYFKNGALKDAQQTLERFGKDKKIIFGGKKLFLDRIKNLISKEEFKIKKLRPLQVVGASHDKGNCKFQVLSDSEVLFKPCRHDHFILKLENIGKNYQKKLRSLILAQEKCEIPITYKLGLDYVYISYDEKVEKIQTKLKLKNRVFAIDLNPNYVGWSVVDWKSEKEYKLIKSGVFSIKLLNDKENSLNVSSESKEKKYITNKRKYEIIQICYELIKTANHYRCQLFGIEDLIIKSSDKERGKRLNKLINNQWNRNLLTNTLNKLCNIYSIHFQKVIASYSSFIGNLVYRNEKLPDPCLSSIEISRRVFEFYHQYILKDKTKEKNIIFDKLENVKDRIVQSLEELKYFDPFENLSDLYNKLKKARCNYRFSLEESLKFRRSFSSLKHSKSYIISYGF